MNAEMAYKITMTIMKGIIYFEKIIHTKFSDFFEPGIWDCIPYYDGGR